LIISLIILGLILALAGLAGSIMPIIPGPPLSILALITVSYVKDWEPFSATFLIIMTGLAVLLTALDYIVPIFGAKRYGASKAGIWGSIAGTVIGFFFIPPWGMFAGAIMGALAGELIAGKEGKTAIRAAWGVFFGTIAVAGLKFAFSAFILFLYIKELF
jgi:uncharacterized protein